MKGRKTEERRVRAAADRWVRAMGLHQWWSIKHEFTLSAGMGEGSRVQATTSANWQYREAACTWNLEQTRILSDADLDNLVVHELTHCLLDPIAPEDGGALLEFSTESVARAIISVANS